MTTSVSIITPVLRDDAALQRTLKSVASQTGAEWRHLFVGREEPDSVRQLRTERPRQIQWLSSDAEGPVAAVNAALAACEGDIVGWLYPGDVYYRDTLRVVVECFDEHRDAGVVFGDAVLFDECNVPRGRYRTRYWSSSRLRRRCCLCQPATFVRRSLLVEHEGLDASLTYWSDYDLWLRLDAAGVHFERTPQLLAGCEVPEATGTIHMGPFARDVAPEAARELNSVFKRRMGKVPARWLVHAGRVATIHDPEVRRESLPHFLSTLRHARAEAHQWQQSAWAAPVAWLALPLESARTEWRQLRREAQPIRRLLPVDRVSNKVQQVSEDLKQVSRDVKQSLADTQQRLVQSVDATTNTVRTRTIAACRRACAGVLHAVLAVTEPVSEFTSRVSSAIANRSRAFVAQAVANSKRRIFKLKNYEPRPLQLPASYTRTRPPVNAPKISIVTPNLNQGPYIEATILSVIDQGYPNLEYIVQDGGSKDESLDVIRRHADRIAHWTSEKDKGQAHAINLGMRHATGDVMAYLNSDDILLPGSLAYVAQYFAKHPDVDVVYGHRVLIDEAGDDIGRWVLPPHDDYILPFVDYVPQETMFWRKRIWDKVGSQLDEAFHFAMDWDLILRFREAGAKFRRLPRFLGAFRISSDNKTTQLLETVGRRDMEILRKRVLGRIPSDREINQVIRPYLRRHWLCDKLYMAGMLRY